MTEVVYGVCAVSLLVNLFGGVRLYRVTRRWRAEEERALQALSWAWSYKKQLDEIRQFENVFRGEE